MSANPKKPNQFMSGPHITICKGADRVIIPNHHDPILKLFREMESELGRLDKLLKVARAEYLLTTK